jgi:hypothetical protein
VTDNTSANKKAWEILEQEYPTKYFYGCASHALHLLVKDIFAASKTVKAGASAATYPRGYPFEQLLKFVVGAKEVVKVFNSNYALRYQLVKAQKEKGLRKLAKAAPTRWGSIKEMLKTILASESLHHLATGRNFTKVAKAQRAERKRVQELITGENFLALLSKSLAILGPIDTLIVKYQSDCVPLSEIQSDFSKLEKEVSDLKDKGLINIRNEIHNQLDPYPF